ELAAFLLEAASNQMREREVDVVAAEQDVVADREPREREPSFLLAHRDEREVARAATYVHDEDDVAGPERLAPFLACTLHPRIERRLRFFEERQIRKARLARRSHRQLSRDRVERSG